MIIVRIISHFSHLITQSTQYRSALEFKNKIKYQTNKWIGFKIP